MKNKTQEQGYPKSLTQEEMGEILEEGFTKVMGKEWDDKLKKYLNMMLHSEDRESIEIATRALSKLMDEKEKKYPALKPSKKTLGFSRPMFSAKEELLSDEYAEKAAKKMYDALPNKEE
tara:strand:- start:233 stop:589 length:357 start_codon:yes stop_codon:yes gene_type:complete